MVSLDELIAKLHEIFADNDVNIQEVCRAPFSLEVFSPCR